MEWKYVVGPAIAFVLSLVAFVPLVKLRLKNTEEQTTKQAAGITQNEREIHRLELLIERKENENQNKAMEKFTEAMGLLIESNAKFQTLIDGQTILIKKAIDSSSRAHERIDVLEKETNSNFKEMNKELVSHPFLKEALKSHDS